MQGLLDPAPADGVFAVYRENRALTYLPDPMAVEIAARIFGHPGFAETEIIPIPLYRPEDKWPDARPFKVVAWEQQEGAIPRYDAPTHTLEVPLGKAERVYVRLSVKPSPEIRDRLAIWEWVITGTEQEKKKLEELALNGQHWMLTPWRTIDIVHAVQRPLIAPKILTLFIERSLNQTSAHPQFVATCSIKSTDRVDLKAEWHEPGEDESGPIDRPRADTPFSVKITDPATYAKKTQEHPQGGIPEHGIPAPDVISVLAIEGEIAKAHEFHDTRYRRIEYWLEATSKFREFLSAEILTEKVGGKLVPTEKNIMDKGERFVTWIPSSARPPAPEVLYVVPTFGWVRSPVDEQGNAVSVGEGVTSSWRRGGGLRVYLDRPWNVSGYGEMLAVVLPPAVFEGDPDKEPEGGPYKNLVTQWGNDPLWESPFIDGLAPQRSDFPLARTAPDPQGKWLLPVVPPDEAKQPPGDFEVTELTLPSGARVDVAPHDVFYDDKRRLWYCDIEIDQGASYWPFVRLALARYQPSSIDGAHLSEVVLADFLPLTSDRWLTIHGTDQPRTRHVSLFGFSYSDSSGRREAAGADSVSIVDRHTTVYPAVVSKSSVVEVWVERLDPGHGEDFGWERLPGAVIQPTSPVAAESASAAGAEPTTSAGGFRFVPGHELERAVALHRSRKFPSLVEEGLVEALFPFPLLWEGTVALPPELPEDARLRMVIAEYEEYLVDDEAPYETPPSEKGRRLVFVEHVELKNG